MNIVGLAERGYSEILTHIGDQGLKPGDRLPSEGTIAEMLKVSRSVVREALVRLSSDGITEARRGAGWYVKRLPSDRLSRHMSPNQMSASFATYEVRFVLEAEAARLAAERRSDHDMQVIERKMIEMRRALLSSGPAHKEDLEFHRVIMQATGNPIFIMTFDRMCEEVTRVMVAGIDISRSRSSEVIRAMLQEHEEIVEAVRVRDSEGAALAMRWHLSQGRKRLTPM